MRILFLFLFIFICIFLFPQDRNRNIPFLFPDIWDHLKSKGELVDYFSKEKAPSLMPLVREKAEILEKIKSLSPVVGVEVLVLAPISGTPRSTVGQKELNSLTKISTLKGLPYFLPENGKWTVFFEHAFCITEPDSKDQIPDPVFAIHNNEEILYARFKDKNLGWYNCRLIYRFPGDYISIEMENTTAMWFLFIPIIMAGNAMNYFFISFTENHIIFYGFTCVKMSNLFGIAESKKQDFYYRIKAIYSWMYSLIQ